MNFEKVELYGFKSFADKAEIRFGDGVTCIVGPNGCGKSNVADAIRWVLGEQSAKTLRGSSMQDFIFSGTQERKPLSYCEVSLFFDNTDKVFSVDYNEVIITRKLFRSGESEYYINKQPARLRDIVDLLREVGVGREGYTIIGQGKVEEIMSAKPEDRRAIFEEATGISKFKQRKNENEHKLERTQENLTRLADIMNEMDNHMGPLERQAKKAREYNELSEQLKHHELNVYISKVESVGADKGKINTRIRGIEEQTALREKELREAVKENGEIRERLNALSGKQNELNHLYTELRVEAEKKAGGNNVIDTRIGFFQSEIERETGELTSANESLPVALKTIEDSENQIEVDKKKRDELLGEESKLITKIRELSDQIAVGEEMENESNKRLIRSIESLSSIRTEKGVADSEKRAYEERVKETNQKIADIEKKIDGIDGEIKGVNKAEAEAKKRLEQIDGEVEKNESSLREQNGAVAEAENRLHLLNNEAAVLKTREGFLRSYKETYGGFSPVIQKIEQHAKTNPEVKKRIKGVVAEIISCNRRFDVAVETALGASAQNVVTETPDDARYLIEYLKQNSIGRLTFLPITSVKPRERSAVLDVAVKERGALGEATKLVSFRPEYKNIISGLLENTLVVSDIDAATEIAKKYSFAFRIVTLEGELLAPQGSMTGGSRRRADEGVLSNERKLQDALTDIAENEKKVKLALSEKEKAEKARDRFLEKVDALESERTTIKQSIVLFGQKREDLNRSLVELQNEKIATEKVLALWQEKADLLSEKLKETSGGAEQLEKDRASFSVEAEKHSEVSETLRKEKEEAQARQSEIRIQINSLTSSVDTLTSSVEKLKNDVEKYRTTISRAEENISSKQGIIEDLKKEKAMLAMSAEDRSRIKEVEDEVNKIEEEARVMSEKLSVLSEKQEEIQGEINGLNEKKHNEEIALTKVDSDLEYLQQSVWEDYQETYETAQKAREENYDVEFGLTEIDRIRARRSGLGGINSNAIEDYKELRDRYDEMQKQKEDLESAQTDIQSALDTIREEMVLQFDEGFKKINENFGQIFKELFGGGKAMLELDYTNATDKLEAGVEIKVEPPGKKLQKLSLYSGGEKALTAIAILFAILKLKPMAFCVLDEIEAALDEANVDRFARYLKKFSAETQFIVITHRKPTMELADKLFGVTMEEKGVSKLVSVNLSDALKSESENA